MFGREVEKKRVYAVSISRICVRVQRTRRGGKYSQDNDSRSILPQCSHDRVQKRTRLKNRRPTDEPLGRFAPPLKISALKSVFCRAITVQFVRPQDVCFLGGYVFVPDHENTRGLMVGGSRASAFSLILVPSFRNEPMPDTEVKRIRHTLLTITASARSSRSRRFRADREQTVCLSHRS